MTAQATTASNVVTASAVLSSRILGTSYIVNRADLLTTENYDIILFGGDAILIDAKTDTTVKAFPNKANAQAKVSKMLPVTAEVIRLCISSTAV